MMPQHVLDAISLLICDDHKVLTDALAMVVDGHPAFRMVAPRCAPDRTIEIVREHRPDVVLMDVVFMAA